MSFHEQIMNIRAENPYAGKPGTNNAFLEGHRQARHAASEVALKADAIAEAAQAVLEWRVDTPTRGDLRDNDKSRAALLALADAVAALSMPNRELTGRAKTPEIE